VLHQAIVSNKTDVAKLLLSDQHRHKLSDINHVDAQGVRRARTRARAAAARGRGGARRGKDRPRARGAVAAR
jgi:hypothetical protein